MTSPRNTVSFAGDPRAVGVRRTLGEVRKRAGVEPVFAPYNYVETPEDAQRAEQVVKLYRESLGHENLAKRKDVAMRARTIVDGCITSCADTIEYLRNKWLVLYQLYRGVSLAPFTYGRPGLHSPEPFKTVENLVPRLRKAIFGIDPPFLLTGEESRDEMPAKHQQALCLAQFREMKYDSSSVELFREFVTYGTCSQKLWWRQDKKEVRYRRAQRVPNPKRPGTSMLRLAEVVRDEFVFDGNDARPISIFDLYAPPACGQLRNAPWIADRSLVPSFEVRAMGEFGLWENLKELAESPGTENEQLGDDFKERKQYAQGIFDLKQAFNSPHLPHYLTIDWWGYADLTDEGTESLYNITMLDPAGKRVIVVARKAPFWHGEVPYQVGRYIALKDEFFGIGALEHGARLSMEIDMKKMLGMAAAQLEANPMLKVGADANVADGQFVAQPGGILRCDDISQVEPLFLPKVSDAAFQAEENARRDFRETTGVTSPVMGQSQTNKTATANTQDLAEGNVRIETAVEQWEKEVLCPQVNQMCWNNQQFLSRERVLNLIGPLGLHYRDRYTIKPQQIHGRFLVTPTASFQLSVKLVQTQQLVNLLDRAPAINQQYGIDTVRIPALLGKIFKEGFGFRDAANFIKLPASEAGILTPAEEHELWYHGEVPPVHPDDNQLRHFISHMQELETDGFAQLEKTEPHIADQARAHIANHGRELERLGLMQEQMMMQMAQQGALSAAAKGPGGGEGGTGFAGPGQDEDSPKFRSESGDESGMPENENGAAKSEAGLKAPNAGAS